MQKNRAKNTGPELKLRRELWRAGLRGYRIHKKNLPGRPDIAFTKQKIAIFVNGCFWHQCPHCQPRTPKTHSKFWKGKFERNKERDERKISDLKANGWTGWTVVVAWECQIDSNLQNIVEDISNKLA